LRRRAAQVGGDDLPPLLERGEVTDRERELDFLLLQLTEEVALAAPELLGLGAPLLQLLPERLQLLFLALDLRLGLVHDGPARVRLGGRGRDGGGGGRLRQGARGKREQQRAEKRPHAAGPYNSHLRGSV